LDGIYPVDGTINLIWVIIGGEGTKLFGFILEVEENLKTCPFFIIRILPINGWSRGKTEK